MADEPIPATGASPSLRTSAVYTMAVFCMVVGLAIGYLMRGSELAAPPAHSLPANVAAMSAKAGHSPTLGDMKQNADRQAAPVLAKLKNAPNDVALLVQVGAIYHTSHQFQRAADYYGQALRIDPKNVAVRTKLASSLYRNGDVDNAIAQLNQALSYEPKDANALFDLGMIKAQGKGDTKGAVAAWQRLLKTNPQLTESQKATVLKLMADAMTVEGEQHGIATARSNNEHP